MKRMWRPRREGDGRGTSRVGTQRTDLLDAREDHRVQLLVVLDHAVASDRVGDAVVREKALLNGTKRNGTYVHGVHLLIGVSEYFQLVLLVEIQEQLLDHLDIHGTICAYLALSALIGFRDDGID